MASPDVVCFTSSAEKRMNKGRKRKIQMHQWKDNSRKVLRNNGNPYINRKNVPVPGKTPSNVARVCQCPHSCGEITVEDKVRLFREFYTMDFNRQSTFLAHSCMRLMDVKRRYTEEAASRRQCSVAYFLPNTENKSIRVCQKTVCDTYRVTPRRLQVLQEKLKAGVDLTDKRGTHTNRPHKITEDTVALIKRHIESFPRNESHYSRRDTQMYYLSPELHLRKMYKLFLVTHPNSKISETFYRDIFRSQYNLKFGLPRSDACTLCDKLYVKLQFAKDDEEMKSVEQESMLHHMKAEQAYKTLAQDTEISKNTSITVTLCVDLQQVLFCPKLVHSSMFYQRQYSCYNLAIHNTGIQQATMCFWHESVAKRGSLEITSCILRYITYNFKQLSPGEVRHLVFWSDRCVGQNNNWRAIALMQHLVTQRYFTLVEQKFLVTGHSFLPCDRDFALIERNKKNFKVYRPRDWMQVLATAKSTGKGFLVQEMKSDYFKDLSIVENSFNKGNFKITDFVWYKITCDDPSTLKARKSHNILQPWTSHNLGRKKKGPGILFSPPVNAPDLPSVYSRPLPIKPEKKKDLLDMCQYIPPRCRSFYENLKIQ